MFSPHNVRAVTHGTTHEFAEWLSVAAILVRFGFSRATTYRLLSQQLIEGRKLGSKTLVNVESVRRYLSQQPRPAVKVDGAALKLSRPTAQTADGT